MCLGIPGQILEITDAENSMAKVDVSGVRREVNIACIIDDDHTVEECVGDWVLVHVGFAMSRIDEEEARRTLKILDELGETIDAYADLFMAESVYQAVEGNDERTAAATDEAAGVDADRLRGPGG